MLSDLVSAEAVPRPTPVTSRHYSREYADLARRYSGESLDVSFRQLVGVLPANEYTHGLYPYPARLLRHIPRFLLATDAIVDGVDLVFDPFVGSGTVLLEAQLRGIASIGVEQNPVAALVSRVKVRAEEVGDAEARLDEVLAAAKRCRRPTIPSTALGRWYAPPAFSALGRLLTVVSEAADLSAADQEVAMLCLVLTARRVATTDPRIPVPVRTQRNANATASDVWEAWGAEATAMVAKLEGLPRRRPPAHVWTGDARDLDMWPSPEAARTTLLLSSPPYGAAQKYVRSTSLEAGWLGHAPTGRTVHIEHGNIGREHLSAKDATLTTADVWSPSLRGLLEGIGKKDARRAAIYLTYFVDMQAAFTNARTTGVKRIALVTGTNSVVGSTLHTSQHLAEIVQCLGYQRTLSVRDPIRGRTLLTARRNGTPSPAEYIDVFEVNPDA